MILFPAKRSFIKLNYSKHAASSNMLFPPKVHRFFFLFGIISMGFGIMLGAFPTSVPQFVLLINWVLETGFRKKWELLKGNKLFWALELLFLIHVAGLIYTEDLTAGIKDLQIKLPLMILPLVLLSSKPLNREENRFVLMSFLLGCLVNTLWCIIYSFVLHPGEHLRNTSRFMSHIRLGLYLNMAIVVCYYFFRDSAQRSIKIALIVLAAYFAFVMALLGLASGLFILGILLTAATVYLTFRSKWMYKLLFLIFLTGTILLITNYVKQAYEQQCLPAEDALNKPLANIAGKEPFIHLDTSGRRENGYYIHINIRIQSLRKAWNARCPQDSFSFEPVKYNTKRYESLIRYLSSKGLIKDSTAVASLSETDIQNIRRGIPNYRYVNWSFLRQRVYELVNEYDDLVSGRNINGNSVTMRYYFWKAAWYAIRENPWLGAGTGDVQLQMSSSYKNSHSPLYENWWKHPHNQFLTVTVALGLLGLLLFLFALTYPVILLRRKLNVLYWCFILVYLSSFMTEDTIETQAGVTFFAFFNVLLISEAFFRKPQNPGD